MRDDSPRPGFDVRLAAALAVAFVVAIVAISCSGGGNGSGSTTGPSVPGPSTPTTIPPSGGPETFVGAGDIAIAGGNAEAVARLLDGIGGTVFTLGDNAYPNGAADDFQKEYNLTWGRHRDRTRPTPGNHDYGTPGAAAYFAYFGGNAGPAGLGYYSYEVGSWHIISLNSNISDNGSAQLAWLRADLAANAGKKCTAALWHHPIYGSGQNTANPIEAPIRAYAQQMFRILYDANADLVLVGHEHFYERFAPQNADGVLDTTRGIRQFVVGTGGVPLYEFQTVRPNSEARIRSNGVLKLTLWPDHYDWLFVPTSGPGDPGTQACH
jgi:hypothetical protein